MIEPQPAHSFVKLLGEGLLLALQLLADFRLRLSSPLGPNEEIAGMIITDSVLGLFGEQCERQTNLLLKHQ